MPINLPNLLTVFRLIAAPMVGLVFVIFASPTAEIAALILFVGAAITDFLDGWLARRWNQISAFGRMLDPIADKAMVVIALSVLIGIWQGYWLIMVPAVLILFREVFVSGLREFLGADAGRLAVTSLAKWKTTAQMLAIAALLAVSYLQARLEAIYYATDPATYEAILNGVAEDPDGLRGLNRWNDILGMGGFALLWIAALLTLITGWDYFRKSLPYLREDKP